MKFSQYASILGTIYLAPVASLELNLTLGLTFMLFALIFVVRGD